jgi:hypothetical protein
LLQQNKENFFKKSIFFQESDMPLKDLLVMYGYGDMSCQDPNKAEDEDEDEEEEDEEEEDDEDEDDDDPASYEPDLKQFYTEMVKGDENGANVKRSSSVKAGEPARSSEAAALTLSINAQYEIFSILHWRLD